MKNIVFIYFISCIIFWLLYVLLIYLEFKKFVIILDIWYCDVKYDVWLKMIKLKKLIIFEVVFII